MLQMAQTILPLVVFKSYCAEHQALKNTDFLTSSPLQLSWVAVCQPESYQAMTLGDPLQ